MSIEVADKYNDTLKYENPEYKNTGIHHAWEKVGDTPEQKLQDSKIDDNKEKQVLAHESKPSISLEQMNHDSKKHIETSLEHNPDWPPAKWNPEAEAHLAKNLETSLNSIV